ncbi:hypothetical protein SeLEV6574_g08242 [Synchytrium endobioticum]|uniref:G-protein coupled receptors family 1 profile domain-containing protein n=1 Tax=Synchytrium endobioticum TaxID=286115 RepID=A0A507C1F4_9FUNG|nr:hypothetical protein SeLEV6574_g08537 [Synchytrium endobioticum]TPX34937.1 hypothetical protein SeLEV6574_g08242 [Synchytrium endobioticum]
MRPYVNVLHDFQNWTPYIIAIMCLHVVSIAFTTCLVTALLSDLDAFRKQTRNLFYLNVVVAEGLFAWFQFIKFSLLLSCNQLLQSRALQYVDAVNVFGTVVVMIWTLTNVALDRWLLICKGIQLSDRAIVAGCVGGWLFVALAALPLLLDSAVTWGEPPIFAGTRWMSRTPIAMFQTMLDWVCVLSSVTVVTTCYQLIRRYIMATKARIAMTIRQSQQLLRRDDPTTPPPVPQVDAELDMCRKFIMLSLASILCGTPTVVWILFELLTGRRAPELFGALATVFIVLQPTVDCTLIIYTNPRIQVRMRGWFRRGRPVCATSVIV